MRKPEVILITGASSGLGAALAVEYATHGITLLLTGRNEARLGAVGHACIIRGAKVVAARLDVTDGAAMEVWLNKVDAEYPVDLCIANAGISGGTGQGTESVAQAREIFRINVDGVMNTLHPLVARMKERGRGQLAIMSSLAGFRGLAQAPAYCASKAMVRVYGEGLRGELAPHGVGVSVICPGFIKTPMTDVNGFPMPFLMKADAATRLIRRKLAGNPARLAFPWPLYLITRLIAGLPVGWTDGLLARLPAKPKLLK